MKVATTARFVHTSMDKHANALKMVMAADLNKNHCSRINEMDSIYQLPIVRGVMASHGMLRCCFGLCALFQNIQL